MRVVFVVVVVAAVCWRRLYAFGSHFLILILLYHRKIDTIQEPNTRLNVCNTLGLRLHITSSMRLRFGFSILFLLPVVGEFRSVDCTTCVRAGCKHS